MKYIRQAYVAREGWCPSHRDSCSLDQTSKHLLHPTQTRIRASKPLDPVPAVLMQLRGVSVSPLYLRTHPTLLDDWSFDGRFSLTLISLPTPVASRDHRVTVREGRLQVGGWAHAAPFQLANKAPLKLRDRLQAAHLFDTVSWPKLVNAPVSRSLASA